MHGQSMGSYLPKFDAWLYASEFVESQSWADTVTMSKAFSDLNRSYGITGFMITDGITVMQYVEGGAEELSALKANITRDVRHKNVITHSFTSISERAYPDWSMQIAHPSKYEALFAAIDASRREALGISIARMLFSATFER